MFVLKGKSKKKNPSKADIEVEFNNLQYGLCEFLTLEKGKKAVQLYTSEEKFPAKKFVIEYLPGDSIYRHKGEVDRKTGMRFLRSFLDFITLQMDEDWVKRELKADDNLWKKTMNLKTMSHSPIDMQELLRI